MKRSVWVAGRLGGILLAFVLLVGTALAADELTVEQGKLRGVSNGDHTVRMFKGIPFAAPPVGQLRWKPPQPALHWSGVRPADKFGPACLQTDVFGDIYFRDSQPSEDCLNLNIWLPEKPGAAKLPVIVWFYGGGFVSGANCEPRYDGENLAKKGVIIVEPNYRLQVFGFLSHPELTKESEHHASGNYGFLDQVAALQWVIRNIAAFEGDPHNITIAGESAGSLSVSALMASPLSRSLFQKAMGESGAFFPDRKEGGVRLRPLAETEAAGIKFGESVGATSLAELRSRAGNDLLQAAAKNNRGFGFGPNLDGYFFPGNVETIYAQGVQSHVPLLAGWNADEGKMSVLISPQKPTAKSFIEQAQARFGSHTAEFLKLYPAANDEQTLASAEALASDDFIAFSTWKWLDLQRKTGQSEVFQYHFEQVPAVKPGAMIGPVPAREVGSRHAGEIEYVFGTLRSKDVPWREDDFKLSEMMSSYWANFAKNGNPNGEGLAEWPKSDAQNGFQVMHLTGKGVHATADAQRDRYEFLDAQTEKSEAQHGGTE